MPEENDVIRQFKRIEDIRVLKINKGSTLTWNIENVTATKGSNICTNFMSKKSNETIILSNSKMRICVFLVLIRLWMKRNFFSLFWKVKGIAKPKDLLCIMGSSGAGKTSLLNVLNFRNINNFKINGIVKINGIKVNSLREISKISSFVQQEGN